MKFLRSFLITAISIFIIKISAAQSAGLKVKEWKEYVRVSPTGKITNLFIIGTPQDHLLGFRKPYPIKIPIINMSSVEVIEVKINNKPADFFIDEHGIIKVSLPWFNWLKDGDKLLEIFASYQEKSVGNQPSRKELIFIPKHAAGAKFLVAYDFGETMNLLHASDKSFTQNGVVVEKGIVAEKGYQVMLEFAVKQIEWIAKATSEFLLNGHDGELIVRVPEAFEGTQNKILYESFTYNPKPQNIKNENGAKVLNFKVSPDLKKITIDGNYRILTNQDFKEIPPVDEDSATEVLPQDKKLLLPTLVSIRNNPEYDGLPLHVKIAKFVQDYVTYDISYVGKKLTVEEIMKGKKGVCMEYATLYNALARLAGIPSVIVYGYTADSQSAEEAEKYRSHAWNRSKIGDNWIHIDPTWGLNKGAVPSTHIVRNRFNFLSYIFTGNGDPRKIKPEHKFDIRPVLFNSQISRPR